MAVEDRKQQILVVEDEGLIAIDIQRRLQRLGYPQPLIASSGEEALRRARSTNFDLVLMDIRLQGSMDGIATAQVFKDELEMPVVYVTAHSDEETIKRAKLTEPFGYILKPISDGDLSSTVQISLHKHEIEKRVRTSEAWLSTTLHSVGEGIIATDTDGVIVFMNPVAERLTGSSSAEGHGRFLMEVLGLFDEATDVPARNPIFDLPPGKKRIYRLVSLTPVEAIVEVECFENRSVDEALGTIVVIRDIGDRRELESRMMQSQRMEAIANLAGCLSHDLNNQLMVILGYADLLMARLSGVDRQEVNEIRQAASLTAAVTGQLLTLSRHEISAVAPAPIDEIIREVEPLLTHSLGKSRTLVTQFSTPAGVIQTDRDQLKEVLINLALAARDATPAGGEVRIETAVVEVAADNPLYDFPPGSYVRLYFADNGAGMDKAALARIFEPSFACSASGVSTNLGLATVHSIVVQSGGHISATSEPGRGTAFEILIPAVGGFHRVSEISGSGAFSDDDSIPTILLVEDDDNVRRLMHLFLEGQGYQLLEAQNAGEAEDLAEFYDEPIHVLVTDVIMPGISGPELARRLEVRRPGLHTLFVSGYPSDVLESQGLLSETQNLLPKPFSGSLLLSRVQELLRQGVSRP